MKKRDNKSAAVLSIGQLADRTGLSVSALRFYETQGLLESSRNAGGQRRFRRDCIRRLSFVVISQQLGFSLQDIRQQLDSLPSNRTPSKKDWDYLAKGFKKDIDERITRLTDLREKLSSCIGCGCLSLKSCHLYNAGDKAARLGAGPRYLLGDSPEMLDSK